MKEVTLCYLLRTGKKGPEVCLAEKKQKYVAGKLNAAGGKVEAGETAIQAALRELYQEQGVLARTDQVELAAVVRFLYPGGQREDLTCSVFVTREWIGEPVESEEMGAPYWYPVDSLPIDRLPSSDAIWLPRVLGGQLLEADFQLDEEYTVISYRLGPLPADTLS